MIVDLSADKGFVDFGSVDRQIGGVKGSEDAIAPYICDPSQWIKIVRFWCWNGCEEIKAAKVGLEVANTAGFTTTVSG
jgi:hypothetical protein